MSVASDQFFQPTPEQLDFGDGLQLLIDYLNQGNTYDELLRVRLRAKLWCKQYFGCKFTTNHLGELLEVHPKLFDLSIPSWDRLHNPAAPPADSHVVVEREEDSDKGGDGDEDDDTITSYPTYVERTLLTDEEIYQMADAMEDQLADATDESEDQDEYAEWRVPFSPRDMKTAAVVFYIPEIMAHFTRLNPDQGMEGSFMQDRDMSTTSAESKESLSDSGGGKETVMS